MCPEETSFKNVVLSCNILSNNENLHWAFTNSLLRFWVPREHPKGSVVDIFCLWKDDEGYILGYWEIADLHFKTKDLVEAGKIFCDLIDQSDE